MSADEKRNITCVRCKTTVTFTGDQYTRPCPKCGIMIKSLTHQIKQNLQERKKECFVCNDGLIQYEAQNNGRIYQYMARCICTSGDKWGTAIPLISECKLDPQINL